MPSILQGKYDPEQNISCAMPSYNIGLDFGTTNSIISYISTTGQLEVFQYGGPDGQKYIPSFIAYEDGLIEIGTAARNTATHHSDVESYGNFKMRLPLPESEFANHFKGDRTPQATISKPKIFSPKSDR